MSEGITLVVRRTIKATPQRVFAAWTEPKHLLRWWGPPGVSCPRAEVDLRIGGQIRIANLLPDGETLWIEGTFEEIEPPHKLVYTWSVGESLHGTHSRVTVRFEARDDQTEVIVTHDRIDSDPTRQSHQAGWLGCLEGLFGFFDG